MCYGPTIDAMVRLEPGSQHSTSKGVHGLPQFALCSGDGARLRLRPRSLWLAEPGLQGRVYVSEATWILLYVGLFAYKWERCRYRPGFDRGIGLVRLSFGNTRVHNPISSGGSQFALLLPLR